MKRSSRGRTSGKAATGGDVATLEDIPNVGPAVAADLPLELLLRANQPRAGVV